MLAREPNAREGRGKYALHIGMSSRRAGKIATAREINCPSRANHFYKSARLVPQRGGSRSSRTRGGMRWTRWRRKTGAAGGGRRSRVVLTPRRWRQGRGASANDGGKKAGHRGEHEVTVKTIAQGRPGYSGEPVVTTLVCFLHLHARLRVQRAPGFPCALRRDKALCITRVPSAPRDRTRTIVHLFGMRVMRASDCNSSCTPSNKHFI
jgi:hypothetical protein